jgi:Na+/pantothenate symporter
MEEIKIIEKKKENATVKLVIQLSHLIFGALVIIFCFIPDQVLPLVAFSTLALVTAFILNVKYNKFNYWWVWLFTAGAWFAVAIQQGLLF